MPHRQSSSTEEPQLRAPEKTYPRFSLYEDLWLTSLLTGLQRHPTAQIMQLQRVEASPHRPRTRSRTSALHSARLRFPQAAVFAENKKTQCASRSPTLARLAPAAAAATTPSRCPSPRSHGRGMPAHVPVPRRSAGGGALADQGPSRRWLWRSSRPRLHPHPPQAGEGVSVLTQDGPSGGRAGAAPSADSLSRLPPFPR